MNNQRKCPICGKEEDKKYKPFCSKKCADIDLGRWLKGCYVIHTAEKPDDTNDKDTDNNEEV